MFSFGVQQSLQLNPFPRKLQFEKLPQRIQLREQIKMTSNIRHQTSLKLSIAL